MGSIRTADLPLPRSVFGVRSQPFANTKRDYGIVRNYLQNGTVT